MRDLCPRRALTPARAYARLMALATLLDRRDAERAREAIAILADAAMPAAESEAA